MSGEPHSLRDLARVVREAASAHPAYGQGAEAVTHCCAHLDLLAAYHEAHHREHALEAELEGLRQEARRRSSEFP